VFASPIDAKATPYWEWHEGSSSTMLKRWVEERFGDTSPDESDYQPGTAYKRIYRPPIFGSFYRAIDLGKRSESFVALRILLHKLGGVFETIEPAIANQATYGHLVRELLLLACNEVESSWAAVLRENHYPARRNGWKTTDYIKLLAPCCSIPTGCLSGPTPTSRILPLLRVGTRRRLQSRFRGTTHTTKQSTTESRIYGTRLWRMPSMRLGQPSSCFSHSSEPKSSHAMASKRRW